MTDRSNKQEASSRLPGHWLWLSLIEERLAEICTVLPDDLRGTLQFITNPTRDMFYFTLAGAKTRAHRGHAPETPDAYIRVEEAELRAILDGGSGGGEAFIIVGDSELYGRFFELLDEAEAPSSWLELQVKR